MKIHKLACLSEQVYEVKCPNTNCKTNTIRIPCSLGTTQPKLRFYMIPMYFAHLPAKSKQFPDRFKCQINMGNHKPNPADDNILKGNKPAKQCPACFDAVFLEAIDTILRVRSLHILWTNKATPCQIPQIKNSNSYPYPQADDNHQVVIWDTNTTELVTQPWFAPQQRARQGEKT